MHVSQSHKVSLHVPAMLDDNFRLTDWYIDDNGSIDDLNKATLESFSQERMRVLYIATQNASIDTKVDFAAIETIKIYRRLMGTSIALSMLPKASTSNRSAAILSICGEISRCFGLPGLNPSTLYEIIKFNLWDDIGHNVLTLLPRLSPVSGLPAQLLWVACQSSWPRGR